MIELSTLLALAAMAAIPLAWLLPTRFAFDGVAVWTACVLILLSWQTAAWLIAASLIVSVALSVVDQSPRRNLVAGLLALSLVSAFVVAQIDNPVIWIGAGFFTLRLLHVVGDWWTGTLPAPGIRRHLRYQLFLPLMFVGPVNRIQLFERQLERRRFDSSAMLSGAERILWGFFSATVIGGYAQLKVQAKTNSWFPDQAGFADIWLRSVIDWVSLYFVFAGLTSVALGISLMMGLRLEENFNQPWRATSLTDFWARWHMSLTSWCRDYVFKPVTALTRSAVAGLLAAMLVVGLWHDLSLYYLLWAIWQAIGVILSRVGARWHLFDGGASRVLRAAMPLLILGWLSLARPIIAQLGISP